MRRIYALTVGVVHFVVTPEELEMAPELASPDEIRAFAGGGVRFAPG